VDVLVVAGDIERGLVGSEYHVAERNCAKGDSESRSRDERPDPSAGEFRDAPLPSELGAE
jgi:hypothetical protein